MRLVRQCCLLLIVLASLHVKSTAQGVQTLRPNVYINSNCNGFIEYLPDGYSGGTEKYPLLLYINGMGSTGSGSLADLENHFSGGGFPHEQIRAGSFPSSFTVNGQTFKFIIITPQFITPYWQRAPTPKEINDVLNYSIQHYRVDTTRIYMAGNSSGGGPVWDYPGEASAYANRIAAILPFCGVSFPSVTKSNIIKNAKVAVWAFHNEFDPGVPVSFTQDYIAMINQPPAPAAPAKATIFPDGGHGCWYTPLNRTYTEGGLNVYQWLLQFSRTPTKAFAGNDQEINLPQNSVQLQGAGTGPNGSAIAWNWTKISGPGGGSLSNASSQNPSVSGLTAGMHIYRLTITDNGGGTATDDVAITVTPQPTRIEAEAYAAMSGVLTEPTSDAGGGLNVNYIETNDWMDYSITVPTTGYYTLRFRVAAAYSGPQFLVKNSQDKLLTTVDIESTGGWQTWKTYSRDIKLVAGTQTIRVLSTNSMGWNFNWIEVVGGSGGSNPPPPPNNPPTANAGNDATITLPQSSVQLSGSGTDTDGSISSYAWSQVSGPSQAGIQSPAQASTSVNNLVAGSYTFRLTVTDNNGATASDNVVITVNPAANVAPTANAGADKNISLPQNSTTLSGSGADSDGSISGYAWTQVSGPSTATISNGNSATATVSSLVQGSYTFRLTVTDNNGATAMDEVIVNVSAAPNNAPTANAGADKNISLPQNSTTLNGSGSDGDGSITAYSWTQVSGPSTAAISNGNSATATIGSLVQGSYTFRLTVTDNNGATASDEVIVNVGAAANNSPTANAGSDQNTGSTSVQLSGSGTDSDGSISGYNWMQISGPSTASIGSPQAAATTVSNLVNGSYVFRLTVVDNNGASATDDITVVVSITSSSNRIEAENFTSMNGVQTEGTADAGGGLNVGYIDFGDWMDYSIQLPAAGNYTLRFRVATVNSNAQFLVKKSDGTVLATVNVPNTGGWQSWQNVTAVVSLTTQQTIRIQSSGGGGWNINWIEWEAGGTPPPPPPTGNRIEAEAYTQMSGVQTEGTSDAGGGENVGWIDYGDWMQYTLNNNSGGNYNLSFRVSSPNAGATFEIRTTQGNLLGTVQIPNTGGWQSWQTVVKAVNLPAASQGIRITSTGSAWNFNWIEVSAGTGGGNNAPTANAGADQTLTLPSNSTQLMGSGADSDGSISGYAWTQVSGPSTANISNGNSATATVSGLVQGSYMFRLTVTDNNGATAMDEVTVTVNGNTPPSGSRIEAEHYTFMSGIQTESTSDAGGGLNVGYIDNGDWMDYAVNPSTTGMQTIYFRVASEWNGAQFIVKRSDGTVLATVDVPNTGGWQNWQTISAQVQLIAGSQTIRLHSVSSTNWNINWLELAGGVTPPPPPPTGSTRIEAENWTTMSGVQTEGTSDIGGGLNVGYIDAGDWMEYSITTPSAGLYTLRFRLASQWSGGQFQVRAANGSVLATVNVPNTGGWQTWQSVDAAVSLSSGTQTIRLVSTNSSAWNINWIELLSSASFTSRSPQTGTEEIVEAAISTTMYPNPVIDRTMLSLGGSYEGPVTVEIVAINGARYQTLQLNKTRGQSRHQLNLGMMKAGAYLVRIRQGDKTETIRMIKQ